MRALARRDPRRRAPLWQQRQKANQLLQVAGEYGSFPVVLEAMRECLQDVFDVPGLTGLMKDLAGRSVRVGSGRRWWERLMLFRSSAARPATVAGSTRAATSPGGARRTTVAAGDSR